MRALTSNSRSSGLFLAAIFLLIVFAPPLKMVMIKNNAISKAEQRKLAEFPTIKFSKDSLKHFPGQFENFIRDHVGFRNILIRCHNYVKALWLKKSPASNIILGKNRLLKDLNQDIGPI